MTTTDIVSEPKEKAKCNKIKVNDYEFMFANARKYMN